MKPKTFKKWLFLITESMNEDDFYTKRGFQNKIPRNEYDAIIKKDPNYKKGQVGKLSFDVLQWYKKESNKKDFMDNIDTTFHNLEFYLKNNKNNPKFKKILQQNNIKGIQDFKNPTELNNIINQYIQSKNIVDDSNYQTKLNSIPKNEYNILFENDEWSVIDVYTHNASYIIGRKICKGGPWCTTAPESRYHFDQYMATGDLYFFLNKQDHEKSYYYAPANKEFANYENTNDYSKLNDFKKDNPELKQVFDQIETESEKQQSNKDYLLQKRFERFKLNPSVEGLLLPLYIEKDEDKIMKWFDYAIKLGVDINKNAIIGHEENENNELVPQEESLLSIAIEKGHGKIVGLLLKKGYNVFSEDDLIHDLFYFDKKYISDEYIKNLDKIFEEMLKYKYDYISIISYLIKNKKYFNIMYKKDLSYLFSIIIGEINPIRILGSNLRFDKIGNKFEYGRKVKVKRIGLSDKENKENKERNKKIDYMNNVGKNLINYLNDLIENKIYKNINNVFKNVNDYSDFVRRIISILEKNKNGEYLGAYDEIIKNLKSLITKGDRNET